MAIKAFLNVHQRITDSLKVHLLVHEQECGSFLCVACHWDPFPLLVFAWITLSESALMHLAADPVMDLRWLKRFASTQSSKSLSILNDWISWPEKKEVVLLLSRALIGFFPRKKMLKRRLGRPFPGPELATVMYGLKEQYLALPIPPKKKQGKLEEEGKNRSADENGRLLSLKEG